jgi:hypothetical protein
LHRFVIAREASQNSLWLALMLTREKFQRTSLLREICDHM